jgi:hypothetical protein
VTDLDALKNRGLVAVGPEVPKGPKTIVVLGVARGSTSIVAGVLAELGVFMGSRAYPPVFEDVQLAKALESGDHAEARRIVADYDERQSLWGFKRPGILRQLSSLHPLLRAPVYLCIFRDVLAVASRNTLSMRAELWPSLRQPLLHYSMLLDFLEREAPPALLVSAEKALLHREAFVRRVVDYLGLQVKPARLERAIDFIQVDPPEYLTRSRLRFRGTLDKATPEAVAGWACLLHRPRPVTLVVSINGGRVGTVVADRPRPALKKRGLHPTGNCGFVFRFPAGTAPQTGDRVGVQFELGGDHLRRSPRTLE